MTRRIDDRVGFLGRRVLRLKGGIVRQKRIVAQQRVGDSAKGLASSKFFLSELTERLKRNRAWLRFEQVRNAKKSRTA